MNDLLEQQKIDQLQLHIPHILLEVGMRGSQLWGEGEGHLLTALQIQDHCCYFHSHRELVVPGCVVVGGKLEVEQMVMDKAGREVQMPGWAVAEGKLC